MWYIKDSNGYKWEELLNLYNLTDQRIRGIREDLFRFTNFYSAVCYAILGFTLYGFVYLQGKNLTLLFLLFGPAMTLSMCILALKVTGRIYRRLMEEISVKAKLENALGLDRPLPVVQFLGEKVIWEKDECLLPPRHARTRLQESSSSEFLASPKHKTFHKDNSAYFGIIAVFSVILGAFIIVADIWLKQ